MYKRKSWRVIKAILKSLKSGASVNSACQSAGVSVVTFWTWRKKDKRLDTLAKSIYDSRITIVEDALYKSALEGNTTAQIFFLKNRGTDRWRDKQEIEGHGIGENRIILITNGNKTQAVARQVCVQQETVPGDVVELGDRKVNVANLAGNVIQRDDSRQPGDNLP